MCRPGCSPLPTAYLRQMARLLQIHKQTHPKRIAQRYGVSDEFVRELWSKYSLEEMAPLSEALEVFYGQPIGDNAQPRP